MNRTRKFRGKSVTMLAALTAAVWSAGCRDTSSTREELIEPGELRVFEATEALNGIMGMAVAPAGDVWVIGSDIPFIHRFDSAGRHVTSFGIAGQGPGELAPPYDVFLPTVEDSGVRVWSPGRAVVTTFDRSGAPLGTTRRVELSPPAIPNWMEKVDYMRIRPMSRWGRGYLVQDVRAREQGLTGVTQVANARLLRVDSAGVILDTLIDFSLLDGPTRPAPVAMQLAAVPVWTVCPDETVAVVDPYGMKLLRLSSNGGSPRSDTLPLIAPRLTDDDIRRWLDNSRTVTELVAVAGSIPDAVFEDRLRQYLTTRRAELGTLAPPAVRILCDEAGHLWLQQYNTIDEPRGFGRNWVVVSDGRIVRRYRFPTRFQPMALSGKMAYGVLKDSLDVERVARVRIPD